MLASRIATALLLLFGGVLGAAETPPRGEPAVLPIHVRTEWLEIRATADDPRAPDPVITRSALRILRAIDPSTGKPCDASKDIFGCDPKKLRRSFRLEKRRFILGEPILVEFPIELDGSGVFGEPVGGNSRARGRDDNFLFLMRRPDGTWLSDSYAPIEGYMGGISSEIEVRRGMPFSYWLAVQRFCAIEEPGTYELFLFHAAHGHELIGKRRALEAALPEKLRKDHAVDEGGAVIDLATGEPTRRYEISTRWEWARGPGDESPLLAGVPEDLRDALKNGMPRDLADWAVFQISIGRYGGVVLERMVERWAEIAGAPGNERDPMGRAEAARQPIAFARQDDFLPLLERWLRGADPNPDLVQGLAMRPSRRAAAILMERPTPAAVAALRYAAPARIPDSIPWLIDLLTHPSDEIRSLAEERLRRFTGESFGGAGECGAGRRRPSVEEGRALEREWRRWGEKEREGFAPKGR